MNREISLPGTSPKRQPQGDRCAAAEMQSTNGRAKKVSRSVSLLAPLAISGAAVSVLDNLEFSIRENPSHEIEAGKKRRLGVLAGASGERLGLSSKRPGEKAGATPSEGR